MNNEQRKLSRQRNDQEKKEQFKRRFHLSLIKLNYKRAIISTYMNCVLYIISQLFLNAVSQSEMHDYKNRKN